MNTFPASPAANQPFAVVFEEARCLTPAALFIDGEPVPASLLVASDAGLWPTFTADAAVLYYRTPGGDVVTFTPTGSPLDLGTSYTIVGAEDDPASLTALIQALVAMGLPIIFQGAAPAVIDSLDPDDGSYAGGDAITVIGSGFTEATGVTFAGTPGTSFSVVDDEHITVTTPAHAPGTVDVIVQDPSGNSDPVDFTYGPPIPVITPPLDPATGSSLGGDTVTITGTGFTGSTAVTFDGTPGTGFTVVGPTEITVVSPAHAAATVDVVVVAPQGDSAPADFEYVVL